LRKKEREEGRKENQYELEVSLYIFKNLCSGAKTFSEPN
jgi:hypothetical protein